MLSYTAVSYKNFVMPPSRLALLEGRNSVLCNTMWNSGCLVSVHQILHETLNTAGPCTLCH